MMMVRMKKIEGISSYIIYELPFIKEEKKEFFKKHLKNEKLIELFCENIFYYVEEDIQDKYISVLLISYVKTDVRYINDDVTMDVFAITSGRKKYDMDSLVVREDGSIYLMFLGYETSDNNKKYYNRINILKHL